MRLREIQDNFKNVMLDPAHLEKNAFGDVFKQDSGIRLENRLKVYRNNVIRGLSDAALSALPMTKKLVGKEFLEQAMRSYVIENLPTEGNLNHYGITFPDFIKNYLPAKNIPYLSDFTRLEWAWETACYAPDDMPLDTGELEKLNEDEMPDLTFSMRKSLTLIESVHPLDEIVDFCRTEKDGEMHELSDRGVKMMVYRPELKVEIRKLDDMEYKFLSLLQDGKTIYETSVTLSEDDPNFNLSALLQKHLGLGTFSAFELRS